MTIPFCGTEAGYMRHNWAGEEACAACKDAHAINARRRRGSASIKPVKRNDTNHMVSMRAEIFVDLWWTASQKSAQRLKEELGIDKINKLIADYGEDGEDGNPYIK